MAYVLNGVSVDISQQAVRPREPSRPSRQLTSASPMMASRMFRPREPIGGLSGLGAAVPPIADKYLQQLASLKGKQADLERLLKQMGVDLKAAQARAAVASKLGNKAVASAASSLCLMLQKDIAACIAAIKACAGKASDAANSAIATGASRSTVTAVSAQASTPTTITSKTSQSVYIPSSSAVTPAQVAMQPSPPPSQTVVYQAAVMPGSTPVSNTKASDVVVESSTASVGPGGQVTLGPDAKVVETPATTDPNTTVVVTPEASSGGIGIGAVIALGVIGYLVLRKK